ncbi:hypothetical protein AB1Y20_004874 [Prymnesium parvum]|uniref:RING-type domain-containing protein n=1 Tax=Prymnesium parvum TaxID=97485 RepID=A0AB34IZF2_PRYPA
MHPPEHDSTPPTFHTFSVALDPAFIDAPDLDLNDHGDFTELLGRLSASNVFADLLFALPPPPTPAVRPANEQVIQASVEHVHVDPSLKTVCAICLEEVEDEAMKMRCSHLFHSDCLLPWLRDCQANCPVCRLPLASDAAPRAEAPPLLRPPSPGEVPTALPQRGGGGDSTQHSSINRTLPRPRALSLSDEIMGVDHSGIDHWLGRMLSVYPPPPADRTALPREGSRSGSLHHNPYHAPRPSRRHSQRPSQRGLEAYRLAAERRPADDGRWLTPQHEAIVEAALHAAERDIARTNSSAEVASVGSSHRTASTLSASTSSSTASSSRLGAADPPPGWPGKRTSAARRWELDQLSELRASLQL